MGEDLMDELVEAVLPICAWLTEIDLASVVVQRCSIHGHTFSIALHAQLWKAK